MSDFIEQLAALVRKHAPSYDIYVYSPIIAQAILESDNGTSELAVNANNFFGLKYRKGRCPTASGIYYKVGSEQNLDGSYTSSEMQWFDFENMEDGVIGYFDFINDIRYWNLRGITDPRTYLEILKSDGYATSLKYVDNLMNVINYYNLTKYDNGLEVKTMGKVFLSAGHGGSNPGAVANGLKEADINLQTLLACKEELERHGVTVVCSRTKDENDDVYEEVREANASGATVAVSFHANAGGGDGFEAFYYSSNANGKRLAELGEKYVKGLGQNSRGVKPGDHLYFVRNTSMTSVLFESFFLDNLNDKAIGDTIAEQKAFGVAYAKAILEYLGVAYKGKETEVTKSENEKPTDKIYRVQCGAFKNKENAERLEKKLRDLGFDTIIV